VAKNKMKTKKAAAKRFQFTATGKVMFKSAQQSSNTPMSRSSRRIKRALALDGELDQGDKRQVQTMVPYWKKRK